MFKKKLPVIYTIISAVLASALTFLAIFLLNKSSSSKEGSTSKDDNQSTSTNEHTPEGNYNIRSYKSSYKYINPILSVEAVNESDKYAALKENIDHYISEQQKGGSLNSASAYVIELSKGDWISINPKERYDPGSLVKVGVLMTYLRMAETDKTLLEKEVVYHGKKGFVFPIEHFKSESVAEGTKYKINDLIRYMIKYSDNRATVFLEDHMDTTIFKKEFTDLGITEPRFDFPSFMLNVKEYSMMFKVLYNAGYLRKRASENALSLLTESTFKDGLLKELPPSVVVAHKFGEQGNETIHELHESGIVYLNNGPYLITIMTKGTDWNKQSEVVGHISKMVYDNMVAGAQ